MLSVIAFYFWQKSMQYKEVDSLVKEDPEEKTEQI